MLRVPDSERPFARPTTHRRVFLALTLLVAQAFVLFGSSLGTTAADPPTIDLRVLVLDDGSPWVDGLTSQLQVEGVPFTAIPLNDVARPIVTPALLSSGDHAFFQAVIAPSASLTGLSAAEVTALRTFEATFSIREVDAFNYPNSTIGLNTPVSAGDIAGVTATVTPAGLANGFQYLNGPVGYAPGSYSYLATPLTATSTPALPAGATFSTLVSAPIVGSDTPASLLGVYSAGGVEQLIITSAFNFQLSQFKFLAHGIISWATRGVHLGYNRNRMTFHVDDAFAAVALWDPEHNCTPGEDCPRNPDGSSIYPETTARMTPDDVNYAVQWQAQHDYDLTLAFNGFYAAADDPLTQALVANKASFRWLNHGQEHIYQGCVQDFSVAPWRCTTDGSGNIVWLDQNAVYTEIANNIAIGNSYGLPFDPTEYLSGEHSGLFLVPQQPTDNPNFAAAVAQAGVKTLGADASREAAPRVVGGALTVPRHPTILYYNAATVAQEVDEYNWLYTSRADGGSGYCEDNPATATCGAPLDPSGYASQIVPADANFNLGFILSNDPRPYYAHTSNLTGDRIAYPWLEAILGKYRTAVNANAPLVNQTLTEASRDFSHQSEWALTGQSATPQVSASVKGGVVTVLNSGTSAVPLTAPVGTTVAGLTLESYGGELSGWLPAAASTTVTLPSAPIVSLDGATSFRVGVAGQLGISATGQPTPTIEIVGPLPAGLSFALTTTGASISGTPLAGSAGSYPITVSATNGSGTVTRPVTLVVDQAPAITSAASASAAVGAAFTFNITATGAPLPSLAVSGALPAGLTFTNNGNGSGRLSGTPTAATTASLTITATSSAGTANQTFTLTVAAAIVAPKITSAASASATVGAAFTFNITATGAPLPSLAVSGALPAGLTFTNNGNGSGRLSGTPTAATTASLTITATSSAGTATQTFTLTVAAAAGTTLAITSAATATATAQRLFTFQVTAVGTPTPRLTQSGTLPTGIRFTASTNGTATLEGTPTRTGSFPITFTATSSSRTVRQSFALTVVAAPVITSGASTSFSIGSTSSFTIRATGSPTPALTLSGALPSGVTFRAADNGTATLSGRPAAGTGGVYHLSITATSSGGSTTQAFSLTVRQSPAFTSPDRLTARRGTAVNFTVTTTGSPTATITRVGSLPRGLTWVASTNGTARITGTPTATGTTVVLLAATSPAGIALQVLTIRVS